MSARGLRTVWKIWPNAGGQAKRFKKLECEDAQLLKKSIVEGPLS